MQRSLFGDTKLATAPLDRIAQHCDILETGNDSYRFKQRKNDIKTDQATGNCWKLLVNITLHLSACL
ncbi:ATP-binding protein [Paucibacter sp. TC2R-5]|uniref:ATP-binding protein n=1 Tax=Paucibacter sp. TC2R-5 TaxID=2893555 RepID=UPI0039E1CAB1